LSPLVRNVRTVVRLSHERGNVGILKALGVAVIVLWLILWLAVKITFGAIHLLLVLGVVLLVVGFLKAAA
jgi:membrane protein required for beta-lactamase induction